jgi:hypothetical protein
MERVRKTRALSGMYTEMTEGAEVCGCCWRDPLPVHLLGRIAELPPTNSIVLVTSLRILGPGPFLILRDSYQPEK